MSNKENEYQVTVEFPKFVKKFDNVSKPEVMENHNILIISDGDRTHHINLDHVDYYTIIRRSSHAY